jgi:uncharacterized delta-60 repeat protein
VVTDVGGLTNEAQNVVVQPADGMIVISGDSQDPDSSEFHTDLARYHPDGQLDPTFGTGGTLTLDGRFGADLAIQPDGRLLLVGTSDPVPVSEGQPATAIAVMRLQPDGTVDDTFGDDGVSLIPVTEHSEIGGDGNALALQPDGRILVAGATKGIGQDFLVARLHADGTPDTEFTDTGVMAINFFRSSDLAESITPTGDNKILVSGMATSDDFRRGFGVARISQQTDDPPVP